MLKMVQEKRIHFHLSPRSLPIDGSHNHLALLGDTAHTSSGTGRMV